MPPLSLRKAITPTGNWVIPGARDTSRVEQQHGISMGVGAYTEVLLHNLSDAAATVTWEVRDEAGAVAYQATLALAARATGRLTTPVRCAHGTIYLRCSTPIAPTAAVHVENPMALAVHPLPA